MSPLNVVLPRVVCEKCGLVWIPRVDIVKRCPRCSCKKIHERWE